MKVLTVSDIEIDFIYSPVIADRFADVDLVLSCGDLSNYYLEYIISMLDVPLYFIRGNHHNQEEYAVTGSRLAPWGGINLHARGVNHLGLLVAGVEGSLLYNYGPCQYTQGEMWMWVFKLVPRLLFNRIRYGRFLDVFISHAPPWKVHDGSDQAHRGVNAFRWLDQTFHPAFHFHGHTHLYSSNAPIEEALGRTRVINTYGYRVTEIQPVGGIRVHPAGGERKFTRDRIG
ncbi:MAG: metallophosphoesterase [Chloroflexi bacterium]|nr:metallophosphoesterase [Chloroflexota bacterium]